MLNAAMLSVMGIQRAYGDFLEYNLWFAWMILNAMFASTGYLFTLLYFKRVLGVGGGFK